MKLKFIDQKFQTDAVNAVTSLFEGQGKQTATFSVIKEHSLYHTQNEYGVGNALLTGEKTLLKNMNEVQKRNNLPLTSDLENNKFCIEMETGTGKTYVYIKTIFELNKLYGFTKFIVVVPSVAIREGVYKSFQIMNEHFAMRYNNVPNRYFIYDSKKLSDVRQFATSSNIEVMIINIDAFKKSENIINQVQDKLNGESAMRHIQDTNPIVIIDEPQSVDNTPKSKEAIASLKPMCVLKYSATHKEKINTLYRLTPVDAYQMGLVKQICVSSNEIASGFNMPYIKLVSVNMENGFKAKIEIDAQGKNGNVTRKTVTVKNNSDLYILSGERDLYEGYIVEGIDCTPDRECIEFTNTESVKLGNAIGDFDENLIKRVQIRRTIETHLEKELRYFEKGIKVLSLFFIDEVAKYRTIDGKKGIYAKMFEECYQELISLPKFAELKNYFSSAIDKIHDGYFSQDKKGNYKNTKGETLDDYSTYNTIMKDKEWLLSFDCPLRFIFSHSALKEGWDNPNVFQVCTLIEQKSTFTCRQKVGRGLRLCVNQQGERIEDKNINILHVMANESFSEFASKLQKEIEDETGTKFGMLEIGLFSGVTYTETKKENKNILPEEAKILIENFKEKNYIDNSGKVTETFKKDILDSKIEVPKELEPVKEKVLEIAQNSEEIKEENFSKITYEKTVTEEKIVSYDDAKEILNHFEKKGYVSKSGKIKDTMKNALLNGTLDLPKKFESAKERFEKIIINADKTPPIRDASKEVVVKLNKQKMLSPEFLELWNKIKQKTTYRVKIDTEELVADSVAELSEMPKIPKARVVTKIASIDIEKSGIAHTERVSRTIDIADSYSVLPNILEIASEQCLVKRATINRILQNSGRIKEFLRNPQLFTERFINIIKENRRKLAVDGISYMKLDGEEYYVQEIFGSEELMANLDKNAISVKNSVYDYVIYDSETVERPFAVALDSDPDVKMFFKIPDNFKIETPIGTYNPDWAVFIDKNGIQKMYFVLETKGTTNIKKLRPDEQMKIKCGIGHFKALDNSTDFEIAKDWHSFKTEI